MVCAPVRIIELRSEDNALSTALNFAVPGRQYYHVMPHLLLFFFFCWIFKTVFGSYSKT